MINHQIIALILRVFVRGHAVGKRKRKRCVSARFKIRILHGLRVEGSAAKARYVATGSWGSVVDDSAALERETWTAAATGKDGA